MNDVENINKLYVKTEMWLMNEVILYIQNKSFKQEWTRQKMYFVENEY